MKTNEQLNDGFSQPDRRSYWIMAVLFVLVAWLRLGTLALALLFGYFALELLSFRRSKWIGLAVYIVAVAAIGSAIVYFSWRAYAALPQIADSSIPAAVGFAERNGIELPFTDYESLRAMAMSEAREGIAGIGRYVHAATFQFVLLLAGLFAAGSLFLSTRSARENRHNSQPESYYSVTTRSLAARFNSLYRSFATVIGAQLIIATINAGLTAVFLLWNGYPYTAVLVILTLLCGLLPIIGNLMSNTLIVGVGFTVSPRTALFALVFLALIHKLEYFLNSKIIGQRIKSPIWLTLIGLLVGEVVMGIPGVILAPVILHYVRVEASARAFCATSANKGRRTKDTKAESTQRRKEHRDFLTAHLG